LLLPPLLLFVLFQQGHLAVGCGIARSAQKAPNLLAQKYEWLRCLLPYLLLLLRPLLNFLLNLIRGAFHLAAACAEDAFHV